MVDAVFTAIRRFPVKMAAVGLIVLAGVAVPALGERPALGMLDGLEQGRWELRPREPGGDVQRVCIGDARSLIQLRHPGNSCRRLVVDDTDSEVTVQYTCPGRGFGRTHIRRETTSLVQIDTQGVAEGLPFASTIEARRIGDCGNKR